jgi:hypothetical protein
MCKPYYWMMVGNLAKISLIIEGVRILEEDGHG